MSATHRRHHPRCIVRAPRASAKSIRRRVSGKGGMDKERGEAQRARLARASDIAASTSLRARFSAFAPDPFLCASSIARRLMTAELCLEAQRARSDVVLVRTADGAAQSYAKKCVWFAPQIARIARSAC